MLCFGFGHPLLACLGRGDGWPAAARAPRVLASGIVSCVVVGVVVAAAADDPVGEPVAVTCRAQCSGGSAAAAVAMTVSCLGGVGESHGRSPRWMQAGRRKRSRRSTAGRRENRKTTGRQRLRRQREKRATLVDERRRLEEGRKEAEAWRWERMSEVEQVGAACL